MMSAVRGRKERGKVLYLRYVKVIQAPHSAKLRT